MVSGWCAASRFVLVVRFFTIGQREYGIAFTSQSMNPIERYQLLEYRPSKDKFSAWGQVNTGCAAGQMFLRDLPAIAQRATADHPSPSAPCWPCFNVIVCTKNCSPFDSARHTNVPDGSITPEGAEHGSSSRPIDSGKNSVGIVPHTLIYWHLVSGESVLSFAKFEQEIVNPRQFVSRRFYECHVHSSARIRRAVKRRLHPPCCVILFPPQNARVPQAFGGHVQARLRR